MTNMVESVLKRHKSLKKERSQWDQQFQVVGEYVSQTKQSFLEEYEQGAFLNERIFDSTATFAMHNASSALLGMLWPSNAKNSIRVEAPYDMADDLSDEEKDWYEDTSKQFHAKLDDPKANLYVSLDEYMKDDITFGTAGIGSFWSDGGLYFRPYSVVNCSFAEGEDGVINTVYMCSKWTIERVVDTYGIENVSEAVRKKYNNEKLDEQIEVLIAYEPRRERNEKGEGFLNMPFRALHIEVKTKHLLKEGGFESFPVNVNRFMKLAYETYGRSPSMSALPDIRELNILREAVIVATEKILDPPLGVMNDGILGNGVIDTSSGAVNVFDGQASQGNAPIFAINTVGDLSATLNRIQELSQNIAQHFYIDRLLDFNNQTQMTATETAARSQIRAASLSSLLSRQIAEVFTPMLERAFFLCFKNNVFGYMPDDPELEIARNLGEDVKVIPQRIAERIRENKESYEVRYTTAAARAAKVEELQGTIQYIQFIQSLAATNPNMLQALDEENMPTKLRSLFGASDDIVLSKEETASKIQASQEQQAQAEQMQQMNVMADTAEKAANAEETYSSV